MKYIIKVAFLTAILFTTASIRAQQSNTERLNTDLSMLIRDAAIGFLSTYHSLDTQHIYGREYSVRLALFGLTENASLYYSYPREGYKGSGGLPESYSFNQGFSGKNPYYKFIKDSLEIVLDGAAKEAGLKKQKVKQDKDNRDYWQQFEYTAGKKVAFRISYWLQKENIALNIYSPYRPKDVAEPTQTLGCVVISYPNFSYLYTVPVYGQSLSEIGDKAVLAQRAFEATGLSDSNYQYTWYPGKTVNDIQNMFKNMVVQERSGIRARSN